MKWRDARLLGTVLASRHPTVEPLAVRRDELHVWVTEIPGFDDDPARPQDEVLDAVQRAWIDEVEDIDE